MPLIIAEQAKDGLYPEYLSKVDDQNTPRQALILIGITVALLAFFEDISDLSSLTVLLGLAANVVICQTQISLRIREELANEFENTFDKQEYSIFLFTISSLGFSIAFNNGGGIMTQALFGILVIACFVYIQRIETKAVQKPD